MTRLETILPELVSELRDSTEASQRLACLAACEFAIKKSRLQSELVDKAMDVLKGSSHPSPEHRNALEELAAKLDGEYLDLRARLDSVNEPAWMSRFVQARSVAAVCFACSPDSLEAAVESIYEASATTDDPNELLKIIKQAQK